MIDAFLALEIGATKLQLVAGTSPTAIIRRQRLAVDRASGAAGIRSQIESGLANWTEFRWRGVGAGFGGPADCHTGRIARSNQVSGWEDFDLAGWLRALTRAPVAVENDANVAAFGEAMYGAGRGLSPVFYTNSGSGVGGGVVVDGAIYHGAPPGEAEFGHLRLRPGGPIVEERCSGWAVDRKIRAGCAETPQSALCGLIGATPGGEARHLGEAVAKGDPLACSILNETAAELAFALSHVVHLFHPSVIVLGGGLSLVGEPWRAAVAAALPANIMQALLPAPPVRLAALGEDVVPIGALALAEQAAGSAAREGDG